MNKIRQIVFATITVLLLSQGAAAMMKSTGIVRITATGDWVQGASRACSWDWGNLTGNVQVTLWKGGQQVAVLAPSCPLGANGKGSVTVKVPANLAPGAYELRVKSIATPEVVGKLTINVVAPPRNKAMPFDDGSRSSGASR